MTSVNPPKVPPTRPPNEEYEPPRRGPTIRTYLDAENPLSGLVGQGNSQLIQDAAIATFRKIGIGAGTMIEVGRGSNTEVEKAFASVGGKGYFSLEGEPIDCALANGVVVKYPGDFLKVDPAAWSSERIGAVVFWGCWATRGVIGSNFTLQEGVESRFAAEFFKRAGALEDWERHSLEAIRNAERHALEISSGLIARNGDILITSTRHALHQYPSSQSTRFVENEYGYFMEFLENVASAVPAREILILGRSAAAVSASLEVEFERVCRPVESQLATPMTSEQRRQLLLEVAELSNFVPSFHESAPLDIEVDDRRISVRERDLAMMKDLGVTLAFLNSLKPDEVAMTDAVVLRLST